MTDRVSGRIWNITSHLEWWAGKYQYSSTTTQLFWVPNHAPRGLADGGIAVSECKQPRFVFLVAHGRLSRWHFGHR